MTEGLRPLTKDENDFRLGYVFELPKLSKLPTKFSLGTGHILDQNAVGEYDFCPAYASCGMSELQEGVKLSRRWSFAVMKFLEGDIESFGSTMRYAMKAHQKFGAIEESHLSPEELSLSPFEARKLENYREELKTKALIHRKQSYFDVYSPLYDYYDTIKLAIWRFRNEKQAVALGVRWGWPKSQYKLDTIENNGYGHMVYITGWDEDGLEVVNSLGKEAGQNGTHRITREVVNYYAPIYGSMMMVDMPKEKVKTMLKYKIKDTDYFPTILGKIFTISTVNLLGKLTGYGKI